MRMLYLPGEIISVFNRWMIKTKRQPLAIFFSLVQPIIWFFLFTEAFAAIGQIPNFEQITGTDNYKTFFTAAIVIQTIMASALQSGIGMVDDMESGYLDKMKVAPISRSSILIGKVLSDAVRIVLQTIIILLLAVLVGVSIVTSVPGAIMILIIAAAFGIAWSGLSTFVGLATKNSETTLTIGLITTFPLLFLSTAVMPKALLPSWVQSFSEINPISYVADATRSLIINGWDWTILGEGFLVIAIVGVITLSATTLMFRRSISG
jgi:ABC-2 type transport system permease protein